MSLLYLLFGLIGFVVYTRILAEVVGDKLFIQIGKWLMNIREIFFYVITIMWMAYGLTSISAFFYGMLNGIEFTGLGLILSVIYELAKYLRKRKLMIVHSMKPKKRKRGGKKK